MSTKVLNGSELSVLTIGIALRYRLLQNKNSHQTTIKMFFNQHNKAKKIFFLIFI